MMSGLCVLRLKCVDICVVLFRLVFRCGVGSVFIDLGSFVFGVYVSVV